MKSIAVIIHARMKSTRCPQKHLRDLGDGNTILDIALHKVSDLKNLKVKPLSFQFYFHLCLEDKKYTVL